MATIYCGTGIIKIPLEIQQFQVILEHDLFLIVLYQLICFTFYQPFHLNLFHILIFVKMFIKLEEHYIKTRLLITQLIILDSM